MVTDAVTGVVFWYYTRLARLERLLFVSTIGTLVFGHCHSHFEDLGGAPQHFYYGCLSVQQPQSVAGDGGVGVIEGLIWFWRLRVKKPAGRFKVVVLLKIGLGRFFDHTELSAD